MKRITGIFLALALMISSAVPALAAARKEPAALQETAFWETELGADVMLESRTLEASVSGRLRPLRETVFTYYNNEGEDLRPLVAYGETLYGRSTMEELAAQLTAQGLDVAAGINGAFFDVSTGIPYGPVVTQGLLRLSGSGLCVGFFPDGSTRIGDAQVRVTTTLPDGTELPTSYNRPLSASGGLGLFSRDFDERIKGSPRAYSLIVKPLRGEAQLELTDTLRLEVTELRPNESGCPIPENGFVLAMTENSDYITTLALLKTLQPGEILTVTVRSEPDWASVQELCGGGELLVENGAAITAFSLDSANDRRPRTAVGLRTDGSAVFYAADGDLSSMGLTLEELALRMQALGCVTALNLDGGGSTAVQARLPGTEAFLTQNRPSDGKLRTCANFIFLVREQAQPHLTKHLHVYPFAASALPGAQVPLTVLASDSHYQTVKTPSNVRLEADRGRIDENGVLTAEKDWQPDWDCVSVTATRAITQTTCRIAVPGRVGTVEVQPERGDASLPLGPGDTLDFTASAKDVFGEAVYAADVSFRWESDVGTVDENGLFTAGEVPAPTKGAVRASYGDTWAEYPVTVSPAEPFTDLQGHPASQAASELYFAGIFTGSYDEAGSLVFKPEDSMTRQEFITVLMRLLAVQTQDWASVQLPFGDAGSIGPWALPYLKAAYALGWLSGAVHEGVLLADPLSPITRQEVMVLLARSQALTAQAPEQLASEGAADWALSGVAALAERGVTVYREDGHIYPQESAKRWEAAQMLWELVRKQET